MKPLSWIKCANCYATGWKVDLDNVPENGISMTGKLGRIQCTNCNGTGYIKFKIWSVIDADLKLP